MKSRSILNHLCMMTKPELTINTTDDCSFFPVVLKRKVTSSGTKNRYFTSKLQQQQQQNANTAVEPTNETSRISNTIKTISNPT